MSLKKLFAYVLLSAGSIVMAQQNATPAAPDKFSFDVAATFAGERSKADPSLPSFWFKGGGVDGAITFWKGLGVAVAFTGDHASDYLESTDENKISFLAGPRYTLTFRNRGPYANNPHRIQLFGQGLVGVAHGFDTRFSNGTTSSNELAVQAGGGLNYYFTRRFGIRPIEVEYVRTQIGATGFSTQNDLRLAAGVTFHF